MNEPEDFLTRWSRRKREVAGESAPAEQGESVDRAAGAAPANPVEAAEPLVDLTKLPSIDAITAETDISGFLAPGVPAKLKAAALRRAWVADPKIRNFVGLADYDWDFHTPGAIPGFGPLEMTDALRREVARIVGDLASEPAPPAVEQPPAAEQSPAVATPGQPGATAKQIGTGNVAPGSDSAVPSPATEQPDRDIVALQQEDRELENLQSPAKRSHGGALPK